MKSTIVTKSKFYVGDPCYALKDDIYDDVWGAMFNYQDGEIKIPGTEMAFAVVGTVIGDGCYPGNRFTDRTLQECYGFGVDSGTIAIIPVELCDQKKLDDLDDMGAIIEYAGGKVSIERIDETETIEINWRNNSIIIDLNADIWDDE